jgi:hypothetical protein
LNAECPSNLNYETIDDDNVEHINANAESVYAIAEAEHGYENAQTLRQLQTFP